MPQSSMQCPYCNAMIPLATVTKVNKDKLSLKIIEVEDSSSIEILSYELRFPLCRKEYEFIKLKDFSWIERRLEPSDMMLATFKNKFPNSILNSIYSNIVGVTRPRGLFKRGHLHICFEVEGLRAYLDCYQKKDRLRGLDIYEV